MRHIPQMIRGTEFAVLLMAVSMMTGCSLLGGGSSYRQEVRQMERNVKVIELADGDARIVVSPAYQGRVMTASFKPGGRSLGWVNEEAVKAGEGDVPFNNYGGADRFWLGPEGGTFALFFEPGAAQTDANWRTPPGFNKGPFEVVRANENEVVMQRDITVKNYAGTTISVHVDREVRKVTREDVAQLLDVSVPEGVDYVGYASVNRITNIGGQPLTRAGGTVSIWSLGMFPANDEVVSIAPYNKSGSGPVVNTDYFEPIPPSRLVIDEQRGVILFRTDAKLKTKIGLSPEQARDRLGSIDFKNRVLTVVHFDQSAGAGDYVNSTWESRQAQPFAGDVTNIYNNAAGGPAFYELESSSPAAFLAPEGSMSHTHRTLHFHGSEEALSAISEKVFGISLAEVKRQLPAR